MSTRGLQTYALKLQAMEARLLGDPKADEYEKEYNDRVKQNMRENGIAVGKQSSNKGHLEAKGEEGEEGDYCGSEDEEEEEDDGSDLADFIASEDEDDDEDEATDDEEEED